MMALRSILPRVPLSSKDKFSLVIFIDELMEDIKILFSVMTKLERNYKYAHTPMKE